MFKVGDKVKANASIKGITNNGIYTIQYINELGGIYIVNDSEISMQISKDHFELVDDHSELKSLVQKVNYGCEAFDELVKNSFN